MTDDTTNPQSRDAEARKHTDHATFTAAALGYDCYDCEATADSFVSLDSENSAIGFRGDCGARPFCADCAEPYIKAGGRECAPNPTLVSDEPASVDSWPTRGGMTITLTSPDMLLKDGLRASGPTETRPADAADESVADALTAGVVDLDNCR